MLKHYSNEQSILDLGIKWGLDKGISMIIGIDILVDMMRTAVNVCGGCVVACIVDKFCIDHNPSESDLT